MQLTNFFAAIDQLAETEAEKARILGISERSWRQWKSKALPRLITKIVAIPSVAQGLARDAIEISQIKPNP